MDCHYTWIQNGCITFLGNYLYLECVNSLVIKSEEQEECSISFIHAQNYY